MRRQLNGLDGHRIMRAFIPACLATASMSLILWGWLIISSDLVPLIIVGGGLVIGTGVYGILIWLQGVSEAKAVVRALENKIKK